MTMESHPAIDGDTKSPHTGGEFETSKESKKRHKKSRRADRERIHERAHAALEPLTIWVRTDPNHLQHPEEPAKEIAENPKKAEREKPAPKVEAEPMRPELKSEQRRNESKAEPKPVKQEQPVVKQVKVEDLVPKVEAVSMPEPEVPKPREPESPFRQEMPEFQNLPRLEIKPRHFYTEPEVRQPGELEAAHDILPHLTGQEKPKAAEAKPAEEPVSKTETIQREQSYSPAEQLQQLAEQKARRAEELERKDLGGPELPETLPAKPNAEVNEHVRAITDGKFESNISMELDQLLEVADSVRMEGVSVTEMFKAERIDEEGLRRIVANFLRGQRIERIVADEILRQQLKFERDPQMRQIPLSAVQNGPTSPMQTTVRVQPRKFTTQTMRRQADRIADRLAVGIDRTVEAAENNPNMLKTFGTIVAVIAYFVVLILIIRS